MTKLIQSLLEMAQHKDDYKRQLAGAIKGAFGEYVCNHIAGEIRQPLAWTDEIKGLVLVITDLIKNGKLKARNSDRVKKNAIYEVLAEFHPGISTRQSKTKMITSYNYPKRILMQIDQMKIDSKALFKQFVEEHIPDYADFTSDYP